MTHEPERYELHYQDETHAETNLDLAKQWHRIGGQQRIRSVGGSAGHGMRKRGGRGRAEGVCGGQDSSSFARYLKRDIRGHWARDLRTFVEEIVDGLERLGGKQQLIIDAVPQWFLDGHRKAPMGRKAGRPIGAKDSKPRKPYTKRANLPAPT